VASVPSIGNINPLFSLFQQEKKEIHDAAQVWGIRNQTDSSHQACRLPAVSFAGSMTGMCRSLPPAMRFSVTAMEKTVGKKKPTGEMAG